MRFTATASMFFMAMCVAAQTPSVTASNACQAQHILDACLDMHAPRRLACSGNDWDCMCNESVNILTCYNNCPDDSAAIGVQNEVKSYCTAYSATKTASSTTSTSNIVVTSVTAGYNGTVTTKPTATTATTTSKKGEDKPTATSDDSEESAGSTSTSESESAALALSPVTLLTIFGAFMGVAGLGL